MKVFFETTIDGKVTELEGYLTGFTKDFYALISKSPESGLFTKVDALNITSLSAAEVLRLYKGRNIENGSI